MIDTVVETLIQLLPVDLLVLILYSDFGMNEFSSLNYSKLVIVVKVRLFILWKSHCHYLLKCSK